MLNHLSSIVDCCCRANLRAFSELHLLVVGHTPGWGGQRLRGGWTRVGSCPEVLCLPINRRISD